jgi:hypothetical protein
VTLRQTVEAGDKDGDSLSIQLASGTSNVTVSDRGNGTAEVVFTPSRDQGGDVAGISVEASDPERTGSFSAPVEVSPVLAAFSAGLTGVQISSTSIADVDGDGKKDLLITGLDTNGDRTATLYLGDGQGDFSEANAGLTGVEFGSTSIADVDGDGNPDLLITGGAAVGDRTATLYLGDGQGGFSEAGAGLTGVVSSSTSIADADGDGNQDLLITGRDTNGDRTATLYIRDGLGFSEAGAGLTGVQTGSTSIADVDGDGNEDLLITGEDVNRERTATLYLGDGQGGFSEAGAGLAGVNRSSTSIADVDGDEDPDLLVTGISTASRSRSGILYENLFDDPLPVELASLEATTDGKKVRLTWQTASETGNAGFEVQHQSSENANWSRLGYVESKAEGGTTTEARFYRYTATGLSVGTHQFRLKQFDLDGSSQVHGPISVDMQMQKGLKLTAPAPNPVSSTATLSFAVKEKSEATVTVYDMLGRRAATLFEGRPTLGESTQVRLDAGSLPSGSYIIQLRADGQTETQRMTIVR